MSISEANFNRAYKSSTAQCKKVYEAVPMIDAWTSGKISNEYSRLGYSAPKQHIEGCLNALVDSGLVKEVSKGMFLREEVRREEIKKIHKEPFPLISARELVEQGNIKHGNIEVKKTVKTPIELLSEVQTKVVGIVLAAKELDELCSEVAVMIDDQFKESEEKSAKLKQLQSLLKSIQE